MITYICTTCEEENYTGKDTLRTTTSKDFGRRHVTKTGHNVIARPHTPIKENDQ